MTLIQGRCRGVEGTAERERCCENEFRLELQGQEALESAEMLPIQSNANKRSNEMNERHLRQFDVEISERECCTIFRVRSSNNAQFDIDRWTDDIYDIDDRC